MTTLADALAKIFPEAVARACPKIPHKTPASAAKHLAVLLTGASVDPDTLVIYRCRRCTFLHVGHVRDASQLKEDQ